MVWALVVLAVLLIAVFLYWQLIIAEGAYMGRRIVALLYDWSAHVYDRIKHFDVGYEQWFLARPLTSALFSFPNPLILDVATGTARLPRTLFQEVGFRGRIIGLDLSRKMLEQAVVKTATWSNRIDYLWDDASRLPFPDETFEAVSCLEALEFMPDPEEVLTEMIRVLRPGGILLTTNRIGRDARLLPGRTYGQADFKELLQTLSLEMVQIRPWQEDYDLVWALKAGVCTPVKPRKLENVMLCPICRTGVSHHDDAFRCENHHIIPVAGDGIVELVKAEPAPDRH
jgi:ubiquinone/menaquinone biosynthesis C-methylase UbiE